MVFNWAFVEQNPSTNVWTIRWGSTAEGDTIYTANTSDIAANQKALVVTNEVSAGGTLVWEGVELDVSDMISRREGGFGDIIWVTIERTLEDGGNAYLTAVQGSYTRWCEGAHIPMD
jgi:hypothetical protein